MAILLSLQLFIKPEVFDCERWFGWLGLMQCLAVNQFGESIYFYGMEPLSNCVELKETLVSLDSVKFVVKCPRNLFYRFKQACDTFLKRLCLNQNLQFTQVCPSVWFTLVCPCINKHVTCLEVAMTIAITSVAKMFWRVFTVKEGRLVDGYGA